MKKYARLVLVFIVVLHTATFLGGCSGKDYPPARKAWFSVEKAPMKIIYIDAAEKMDLATMRYMMEAARRQPYHNYTFHDSTNIVGVTGVGEQNDHESDTDTKSTSLSVSR